MLFADSSFANNVDSSAQLGFIIMLTYHTDRTNCLYLAIYKSKIIVRSVLDGETYAFADEFDSSIMLRHDLECMVGRNISLNMSTDSESFFRVIEKAYITTKKRLMVDIRANGEVYGIGEKSDVGRLVLHIMLRTA